VVIFTQIELEIFSLDFSRFQQNGLSTGSNVRVFSQYAKLQGNRRASASVTSPAFTSVCDGIFS